MIKVKATFLDDISWDIPHQNWGPEEWDRDFAAMKAAGIDTVVLIRVGLKRWTAYPSKYLHENFGTVMPDLDLVDLYLSLAEKYDMKFFFSLYCSVYFPENGMWDKEIEINREVVREGWAMYGHRKAFKGWYISHEISARLGKYVEMYADIGRLCKELSGGLPVMISPYIKGCKVTNAWSPDLYQKPAMTAVEHEKEWRIILGALKGVIDIVCFQDGTIDFFELKNYLEINRKLCSEFGMECWTNCESFDRDMPIKFLPIKWEKMLFKLRAAEAAGYTNAITFEFSHFMSPNSVYGAAHGLYKRYMEYLAKGEQEGR
jgi:hypothetical protein